MKYTVKSATISIGKKPVNDVDVERNNDYGSELSIYILS